MFVTNLTQRPLGVDGIIILKPKEEMRYVDDTTDLLERVSRLKLANLVTVSYSEGLVKAEPVKEEEVIEDVPVVVEVEAPVKNKRGVKHDNK